MHRTSKTKGPRRRDDLAFNGRDISLARQEECGWVRMTAAERVLVGHNDAAGLDLFVY